MCSGGHISAPRREHPFLTSFLPPWNLERGVYEATCNLVSYSYSPFSSYVPVALCLPFSTPLFFCLSIPTHLSENRSEITFFKKLLCPFKCPLVFFPIVQYLSLSQHLWQCTVMSTYFPVSFTRMWPLRNLVHC